MTYSVDSLADLDAKVLPFFERHPLVVKDADFQAFAQVVRSLVRKEHFTQSGFERLVRLAYGMNAAGKQRARSIGDILGSSETARQAVPRASKIQSDLHGDMQSQAEMTWPLMRATNPDEE